MNNPAVRMMVFKEAREAVDKINSNMNNVRYLVLELYEREGWTALGYGSWRECVTAEFKGTQQYLYYQLEAAQTGKNISTIVEKPELIPESQLRPLTKLRDNPDQQREAWQKAVETAPKGKVTASHVYKIVKEMTSEPEKQKTPAREPPPLQPRIPQYARQMVDIAISQLERIHDDDPTKEKEFDRLINWINQHRG